MIYEMRSYRAMPGRLPDLLKRFDTITLKLFEKHGIKQAGFWVTEVGEFEPQPDLPVRLRVDGRPREEMGRVLERSRVAREARRDREERPAGDDVLEPVPQADELFEREVSLRSRAARCAPPSQFTPPPSSYRATDKRRARMRRREGSSAFVSANGRNCIRNTPATPAQ